MKRVLYFVTSPSHKRAFELFESRQDLKQMVVGPVPKITNKVVPEDYSDFKIKKIRNYQNRKELHSIVSSFDPDIFVSASLPIAQGISLPARCKKVYVSHGMVGSHVIGMIKKAGLKTSVWKGADLYCGASPVFSDWVKKVAKVGDDKILLNALPQLDLIYNPEYYNSYRDRVLKITKNPTAKRVILFAGFCCKDRYDFLPHNEDYFRVAIELEKVARKNNWLIMVKPRQTYKVMIQFLKRQKWGKKYLKDYANIQNSKYLHFITTTGHIFRYFFADAVIINGISTIEIEACAVQKPLFVFHTKCPEDLYDPFGTISSGAATIISNISEIGNSLESSIKHCPDKQMALLNNLGITFDGKMHKRIQDRLVRM